MHVLGGGARGIINDNKRLMWHKTRRQMLIKSTRRRAQRNESSVICRRRGVAEITDKIARIAKCDFSKLLAET